MAVYFPCNRYKDFLNFFLVLWSFRIQRMNYLKNLKLPVSTEENAFYSLLLTMAVKMPIRKKKILFI